MAAVKIKSGRGPGRPRKTETPTSEPELDLNDLSPMGEEDNEDLDMDDVLGDITDDIEVSEEDILAELGEDVEDEDNDGPVVGGCDLGPVLEKLEALDEKIANLTDEFHRLAEDQRVLTVQISDKLTSLARMASEAAPASNSAQVEKVASTQAGNSKLEAAVAKIRSTRPGKYPAASLLATLKKVVPEVSLEMLAACQGVQVDGGTVILSK